jgi:hypothetical protein
MNEIEINEDNGSDEKLYRCYVCGIKLSIDDISSVDQFGNKYCSDKCAIEACGEDEE